MKKDPSYDLITYFLERHEELFRDDFEIRNLPYTREEFAINLLEIAKQIFEEMEEFNEADKTDETIANTKGTWTRIKRWIMNFLN